MEFYVLNRRFDKKKKKTQTKQSGNEGFGKGNSTEIK